MKYFISSILLSFIFSTCTFATSNKNKNSHQQSHRLEKIKKNLNHPTDSYVLVASHRGDWRNAPENSLQAIKNCIAMEVDIVEIDVRMTKDSVLVLMHDATINRTTTGKGKIKDFNLDELKTLRLKNGCGIAKNHKIPTLEEAMLVAKDKIMVNLDKCSGYMDLAYDVLEKTGTVEQAIFKGSKDIINVQKQYGDFLEKIIYMPIIKEKTPHLATHINDFLTKSKPVAFEVLYNRDNSPMFKTIKTIRKKGSGIWVNSLWESLCGKHDDDRAINDPEMAWGWIIKHGANIIQTDRPELLLEYLRENNLHD